MKDTKGAKVMDTISDTYAERVREYVKTGIIEVDTQVRQGYYAMRWRADHVFGLLGLLFFMPGIFGVSHIR